MNETTPEPKADAPVPGVEWQTAIAEVQDDDVLIRGYQLSDLVGEVSYTEAVFLVLTGNLPDDGQRRMLDAVLVSLIEHGISPSTILVRILASCGTPLQAAVAGGVLSIADWHGGSGEQVADLLVEVGGSGKDAERRATEIVDRYRDQGRRVEGFGHPQHGDGDPRAGRLTSLATRLRVAGTYVAALATLEHAIEERFSRSLRPNITSAIAAVLLDLGFPAGSIRGIVIGARAPGLVAHAVEELEQGGRWRHAKPGQVRYTGMRDRTTDA